MRVRDISNRKMVEAVVEESEERYRALAEAARDQIYIIDRDDRIVYANSYASSFFGVSPEQLIGRSRSELFPPEMSKAMLDNINKVLESGDSIISERKIAYPTSEAWLETRLAPIRDASGKINAVLGISRDVTTRKVTEQALSIATSRAEDEKAKSEAIIAAIGDGISIQDIDFKILYQNDKHKELIGDHVGERCYRAYRGTDAVCDPCHLSEAFKDGKVHVFEQSTIAKGKRIFTEITASPLKDPSGRIYAGIEVVRDITERKKMEQMLQNAYEIEHRIAEALQSSLIKPVPDIAGLEIGIIYQTAHEAERVGGDFYDIFELDDGQIAILIGDVAGKGVKAAGLTETIKSSVRTLAYIDPSPSFVLGNTNQALLRQLSHGQFATAVFMVLDKKTGDIRLANAGHPPVVVCGAQCGFFETPFGVPLGAFSETYQESYIRLAPGDKIVLYTDGLIEGRKSGLFDDRKLLKTIDSMKKSNAQEITEKLLEKASADSSGKFNDDVAIVAIRLSETPARP